MSAMGSLRFGVNNMGVRITYFVRVIMVLVAVCCCL